VDPAAVESPVTKRHHRFLPLHLQRPTPATWLRSQKAGRAPWDSPSWKTQLMRWARSLWPALPHFRLAELSVFTLPNPWAARRRRRAVDATMTCCRRIELWRITYETGGVRRDWGTNCRAGQSARRLVLNVNLRSLDVAIARRNIRSPLSMNAVLRPSGPMPPAVPTPAAIIRHVFRTTRSV